MVLYTFQKSDGGTVMIEQEKQLLVKVLCEGLPHKLKVRTAVRIKPIDIDILGDIIAGKNTFKILPYLRPMSSMTEKEMSELRQWGCLCMTPNDCVEDVGVYGAIHSIPVIDWLNSHYFDYRGLIPMGLALPATKEMYQ